MQSSIFTLLDLSLNIYTPPAISSETSPLCDSKVKKSKTQSPPEPEVVDLEEKFSEEPEAISKITRTREDGTKYVEIEYDDGSIETLEINIDEE